MWAVIGFVVFAIVQAFPLNASGQTWGKKLLKIKIVDLDGGKPTLGRLLGMRYLPVQAVGVILLIGALIQIVEVLLIFRSDRRCGHDLIAGTRSEEHTLDLQSIIRLTYAVFCLGKITAHDTQERKF